MRLPSRTYIASVCFFAFLESFQHLLGWTTFVTLAAIILLFDRVSAETPPR